MASVCLPTSIPRDLSLPSSPARPHRPPGDGVLVPLWEPKLDHWDVIEEVGTPFLEKIQNENSRPTGLTTDIY